MELDNHQAVISVLVAGFAILVVFPVWWNTTKVYRATIPYDEIAGLSRHRVRILVTVDVYFQAEHFNKSNLTQDYVGSHLKSTFSQYSGGFVYDVVLHSLYFFSGADVELTNLTAEVIDINLLQRRLESLKVKLNSTDPTEDSNLNFNIFVSHASTETSKKRTARIDKCDCSYGLRSSIFLTCFDSDSKIVLGMIKQTLSVILPDHGKLIDKVPRTVSGTGSKNIHQRAVQHSQGLQVSFILASPDPGKVLASWDIKEQLDCNFLPFLSQLDFLGPFQITSQILYYAELGKKPKKGKNGYFYGKKDLPMLINPLEARIGSFTSTLPTLYFIVYITPPDQSPLYIKSGKGKWGSSFLSPKWGGIYLYNMPSAEDNITLTMKHDVDMHIPLENFKEHFKMLVGAGEETAEVKRVHTNDSALSEFDVNLLILKKAIRNINLSMETLLSLSKLVWEIQNLIIEDNIKDLIVKAVRNLNVSIEYFQKGMLKEANRASRVAVDCSEKAFFDPTLLELLYFPEDQKFAIYIPLFLPLGIPILLSVFKVLKSMRSKGSK